MYNVITDCIFRFLLQVSEPTFLQGFKVGLTFVQRSCNVQTCFQRFYNVTTFVERSYNVFPTFQ